jgi:methionyl-tRNA formyltransferase
VSGYQRRTVIGVPSIDRRPPIRRRLAYLGTPELAVQPLEALVAAGEDVAVVVTRPDRRRGRGSATSPSPVKAAATALGIDVVDDHRALLTAGVDLGIVVAYGRIVPADVLAAVPMVNLHFSLLPRWRGAAPVERAILAGDDVTGVCVMKVEEGLDTGPVYAREEASIGAADDLDSLRERLVEMGSRLLVDVLSGPLPAPTPQAGEPTYAAKIDPAELELRWDRPAVELGRVVRLGRAWTTFRDHRLRVRRATVTAGDGGPPGTLDGDVVATGDGGVQLVEVQPEGKGPMAAADWLRGVRPAVGERLG